MSADTDSPLVSVVIPCRNEVKSIRSTVLAILAGDYQNLEILVVDGMSEDGTRAELEKLSQEDSRVRMIDNPNKKTPYAFNLGVVNARGEFVQIVGSRNVLASNYISILMYNLETQPDVACVGGDFQHVSDTPSGEYLAQAMESKFGVGFGNYRTMQQNAYVDTVGIPMYRRSIFSDVGLFDENLTRNQDDDFNFRVRAKGYKILYVHAAKATYLVRASYKKAFHQFSQYGYFKVFVNRKHKAVTTMRQLVPPVFVLVWLVGLPLSLFSLTVASFLSTLAFVYIVLGLFMSTSVGSVMDRLYVTFNCAILHFGYGWGYLRGVWDFLVVHRPPSESFQRQTL